MNLGYCNETKVDESYRYKSQDDWSHCFMKNPIFDEIGSKAATISLTTLEIVGICCNALILFTFKVLCALIIIKCSAKGKVVKK